MSKFYRPDNQYFMNLMSNLFSHVARYNQKEIVCQNHKLQIISLLKSLIQGGQSKNRD